VAALRPSWPSCAGQRGVSTQSRSLAPRGAAAATGAVKGATAAETAEGALEGATAAAGAVEGATAAKGAVKAEEVAASARAAVEVKESKEKEAALGLVMVREVVMRETGTEAVVATAMAAVVGRESVVSETVAASGLQAQHMHHTCGRILISRSSVHNALP
jgi:hypothetical protein